MSKEKTIPFNQTFEEEKSKLSVFTHKPKELLMSLDKFISNCEENLSLEGAVEISYSQANYIRNLILLDEQSTKLSLETLKRVREFGRKLEEKRQEENE